MLWRNLPRVPPSPQIDVIQLVIVDRELHRCGSTHLVRTMCSQNGMNSDIDDAWFRSQYQQKIHQADLPCDVPASRYQQNAMPVPGSQPMPFCGSTWTKHSQSIQSTALQFDVFGRFTYPTPGFQCVVSFVLWLGQWCLQDSEIVGPFDSRHRAAVSVWLHTWYSTIHTPIMKPN